MIGYDNALDRLFERTSDLAEDRKQKNRQRRTQVTDLFGVEYTRLGDGGSPATFYVSISPDMVYLERFACKLIIQPFVSSVASQGTQSTTVTVNPTSLSGGSSISPNPHTHTTQPHTHNVISGVTLTHTTASDFTVRVSGVDVTPYLMAQTGGSWIDGEGIYPDALLGTDNDWYDFLQVSSDLEAEGKDQEAQRILSPGYKTVQVGSNSPFQVTYVSYLKFSHLNR